MLIKNSTTQFVPPEEPKFQPEKYVVSKEKFDITGDKLVDDDKELADKYADTNANPYADDASNNEPENLNTKTVETWTKIGLPSMVGYNSISTQLTRTTSKQ